MQTPLQQIRELLIDLQDQYGFTIDVSRMEACLICMRDITDLDEVFFRLQSLVCKDDQQLEKFRSLFGQRFLRQYVQTAPVKDSRAEARTKRVLSDIEGSIPVARYRLEESERRYASEKERLEKAREKLDRDMEAAKEASKIESLDEHAPAAIAKRDPAFAKKLEGLLAQIRSSAQAAGKNCEALDQALSKVEAPGLLKKMAEDVLSSAVMSRRDPGAFRACLDLAKALDALAAACKTAIGGRTLKAAAAVRKAKEQLEQGFSSKKGKIEALERSVDHLEDAKRQAQERLDELQAQKERTKSKLDLLVKEQSKHHRETFTGECAKAVQTTRETEKILSTPIQSIGTKDMELILSYIRTNAQVFRQTLRRKSAVPIRRAVDVRRTIQLAAQTGGELVHICYKEPKKSHAKIVFLVDISGSCRRAASLGLYLMAMLDTAFPGGCKKFAFVNRLVPVDRYFRDRGPAEGVDAVNSNVPSKGVYSNYGRTIEQLCKEHESLFHKDTTVIIFGDGRNNRNPSAAGSLHEIAARSHKVFWLVPEAPGKWGTGDSMIPAYEGAGAKMVHVSTAGDLIGFLSNARYM